MLETNDLRNRGWTVVMPVKTKDKIEWNVFYYNINRNKIDTYNIFEHESFVRYVKEAINEHKNKEKFEQQLKSELQYYFGEKCEWEILLSPWVSDEKVAVQINVYEQVMLNFNVFVDYVWKHKKDILYM